MKKIIYWLSKLTCVVAMGMAVASVNSTCFFTAYQPDVPRRSKNKMKERNIMDTEYTSPIIEEFDDPTDTFKDNEFVYTYAILAVVGVVAITFGAVLIEMVSLDADGKPVA